MTATWKARIRYWWLTGRKIRKPKRYNGSWRYPVRSAQDLANLARNQAGRGVW